MTAVFEQQFGDLPLLISVPHDGRAIPDDILDRMTDAGRALPDTDWDVARLYKFAAEIGANTLVANYSRYVVDLNRPSDDAALYSGQVATGLCPLETFAGDAIYRSGDVDDAERADRVEKYWRPYHDQLRDTLAAIREAHGYALLWDAHSIPSIVPRLFDGELPELNLGSNGTRSCARPIEAAVARVATASSHSAIVNGRFKGGYITRHYGAPEEHIHALQLEIAQRAYMSEESQFFDSAKAAVLRVTLRKMLASFMDTAKE